MPDSSPEEEEGEVEVEGDGELLRRVEGCEEGRRMDGSLAPLSLLTSMPRKAVGAHMAMAQGLEGESFGG
jgi:hypothetical protein